MKIDRDKVEQALLKKGFEKDKSKDHIYFYHKCNGKLTGVYTYISHTKKLKDISGDILLSMKRQLYLDSSKDFSDLITCPLDGNAYNRILAEKGIL